MAESLSRDQLAELFARARETDIVGVVEATGGKLFRAGRRLRGPCPLCGASQGKRADGAFSVEPHQGWFKCFACGEGGDVIDLERGLGGGSLFEAAVRLVGRPAPTVRQPPLAARPPPAGEHPRSSTASRIGHEIWSAASHSGVRHNLAGRYLQGRGLRVDSVASGWGLRFTPQAKWGWEAEAGRWIYAPAMVAKVETPSGATGGWHCTYLAPDGSGKADLDPAKRMWGPQKDLEGRPGGVWLTAPDGPGPLIVGEGIESTLAAMQLVAAERGGPVRGVATLSLGALQGGWLLDRFGRMDPAAPSPDPERPAFTWPGQDQVLVAVDRDMKPIEVKVRKAGGGTVRRRLEAEDRARICAGLALAAWRAAGANAVRAIAPAAGRDFNDELQARLAAGV